MISTVELVAEPGYNSPFDVLQAQSLISACDTGERITPNQTNFHDSYWLWDSAFIATGLAFTDPKRAQAELVNLMSSQHTNGMVPHMVLRPDTRAAELKHKLAYGSDQTDADLRHMTSGITQPPNIAIATRLVAEQLTDSVERNDFMKAMYGKLVAYHQWFVRERDLDDDGVVTILHPWESGMDNSPTMLSGIKPTRFERALGRLTNPLRNDVHEGMDAEQRTTPADGIALAGLVYRLRAKEYEARQVLADNPTYAVDSVLVNQVLLKATKDLQWMADQLGRELPPDLIRYLDKAEDSVQRFWREEYGRFFDIDAITGSHIKVPTIANLLPIMNPQQLSKSQQDSILQLFADESSFSTPYAVPTIATTSRYFNPDGYWSGPMWPWMNRFLYYGAREVNEVSVASRLRQSVLDVVGKNGAFEHYNPIDGRPGGAMGFAPTAATFIELDSARLEH